ncbi:MAG: hypothetical protein QXW79_00045 [Thermoplasmata archaeon]
MNEMDKMLLDRRYYFRVGSEPLRLEKFSMMSTILPIISTNGCILFHNVRDTYVMWSNGCLDVNGIW